MPEGHTIHALARRLDAAFAGHRVQLSSPQGRFAAAAAALDGSEFLAADAVGKHLFLRLGEARIHVHLGLFGKFNVKTRRGNNAFDTPPVVGQVRLRLLTDGHVGDLRGPTACELIDPEAMATLLGRLGPDPLADVDDVAASAQPFLTTVAASRRSISSLLMDQRVLAGVGNVYRAEVLYRAGLNPDTEGRHVGSARAEGLWRDLSELMRIGVEQGRILTHPVDLEPLAAGLGRPGRPTYWVYRRHGRPCLMCGETIAMRVETGRKLYWCPACQSG